MNDSVALIPGVGLLSLKSKALDLMLNMLHVS